MELTPRGKRARSVSSASSSSDGGASDQSRSLSPEPFQKYHRSSSDAAGPGAYLCTLPPTCSQPGTATSFASQTALDKHQESFHRWICHTPVRDREAANAGPSRPVTRAAARQADLNAEEDGSRLPEGFVSGYGKRTWKECGKVFPEERLFELHQTETHDPIARERQSRGEKIFACFLPPDQCDRVFLTPTSRRKHLIAKHKYPQQYFFAVTNHGINQIAQEDGLAASLIRPRKEGPPLPPKQNEEDREGGSAMSPVSPVPRQDADHPRDVDMDDLTAKMTDLQSSLAFVPRGVRKKGAARAMDMMSE